MSDVSIQERTETSKTDGVASIGLGVHLDHYSENHESYGFRDVFDLRLFATVNARKVVSYGLYSSSFYWHDNLPNTPGGGTLDLGDNDGAWVWMDGIVARFYGGANSAEYDSVWVSSNGFVGFDPTAEPTSPYYAGSIPNTDAPNTFAAPFWRDLDPSRYHHTHRTRG